jgi:SAM-dependent methyltransferase
MIERRKVASLAELRAAYNAMHSTVRLAEKPRFFRWTLEKLEATPGARLLDIGCGRGGLLAAAAERGLVATGVEISDAALAAARAEVPGARVALADGERLPFRDGAFPLVTHLGNLEHFLDPRRGAREAARVLAPGGRAAFLLPNAYYSGDLWRVIRTGYGPDHKQPIDRFATAGEWRDLLQEAGFRVTRAIAYNKFKLWKRIFPFQLAYHFLFICEK